LPLFFRLVDEYQVNFEDLDASEKFSWYRRTATWGNAYFGSSGKYRLELYVYDEITSAMPIGPTTAVKVATYLFEPLDGKYNQTTTASSVSLISVAKQKRRSCDPGGGRQLAGVLASRHGLRILFITSS
jgi:hypothetical protein